MNREDTIAAICSGVGGSINILRISGKNALTVGNGVWKSKQKLCLENKRRLLFGKILPDSNGIGESALAVFMPAASSYTGDDVVEIHAHGGAFNARRLMEEIVKNGARQAEPGEFTFRAFLNGKMDLTQAEAVSDIVTANSDMAIHLAERQMDGVLGRKIAEIRNKLIEILVECESRLDFSEEELDFVPVTRHKTKLLWSKREIENLYSTRTEGAVLRDGIRVVIAGRPNAGKSSLLNLLLGYDRAITTSIPGTTRDTLEEFANIRGIPVKLVDTAGLRKSSNEIEEIGIKRTLSSLKRSQITVWMLDASFQDLKKEQVEMERHFKGTANVIAVWNKVDLHPNPDELVETVFPTIKMSVKEKTGINEFLDNFEEVAWKRPHLEEPEVAVSARHATHLANTLKLIPEIIRTLTDENWELAAINLSSAVEQLGNIIGAGSPDIYETIFSKFCIGK